MPIHKRIPKEKLRKTYEVTEMLDHVYDLFLHIAKDIAPVSYQSVTKGCQKTITKFSKKLKDMIQTKGDFYFPKSRDVSPINSQNRPSQANNSINIDTTADNYNSANSNEIVINQSLEETKVAA